MSLVKRGGFVATALITGASSGIGKQMALMLAKKGYDLVLVARDKTALRKVASQAKVKATIVAADLSDINNCKRLYHQIKDMDIEVLVNNAGFGVFGNFNETSLDNQLDMLNLNVSALHTLTYLFLQDFVKKDKGYILNVASLAAFGSGPLMAGYYATKAYVYRLTTAINQELRAKKSNVKITVLCPGPVDTNFNNRAGVKFSIRPKSAKSVAKCGLDGMFKGKTVVIPGLFCKISAFGMQHAPLKMVMGICHKIQKGKLS